MIASKRKRMIDTDRMICICNSLDMMEIAECIKENDIKTLEELVENADCPMGDKCESCREDGFENDGYSLAMVLSLVREGRL
jgi:bacterioferritin-associated ferredoxin